MFEYSFETAEGVKSVSLDCTGMPERARNQVAAAVLHQAVSLGLTDTTELRAKLAEVMN